MEVTMSVQWMAFYLITLATAVLLVRLFFLYSQYVKLSHLPRKNESVPVPVPVSTEQDSAKNEAEKALSKTKLKPVKKSAKKKPAKKSKKKKG